MYSVVLMAALTVAPTTPGCHWGCGGWGWRSGGCWGSSYSCYGCYGSSFGYSCVGCWGSSCYGCWGGWGYSCCGGYSCYGCYGSSWSCMGCWGSGYGCGGGYGYVETGPVVPGGPAGPEPVGPPRGMRPTPNAPPRTPTRTNPGTPPAGTHGPGGPGGPAGAGVTSRYGAGTAQIVVQLPANGKLYVDDHLMTTPTGHRTFTTPQLDGNQAYYYIFRAEVVQNGKVHSQQKRIIVRAGDVVKANFNDLTAEKTVKAISAR
jgi:uncharacterized protein (TIGR03000 family)